MSYTFLDRFGKTPLDLGARSWDEVDPCWGAAMLVLDSTFERMKSEALDG